MPQIEVQDPRATTYGGRGQPGVAAGVDIGNGVLAIVVISATRTKNATAALAASTQLVAANIQRIGLLIQNNDAVATLWLGFGTAAVVGTGPAVAPGGVYFVPAQTGALVGAIYGIQSSGATAGVTTVETDA